MKNKFLEMKFTKIFQENFNELKTLNIILIDFNNRFYQNFHQNNNEIYFHIIISSNNYSIKIIIINANN